MAARVGAHAPTVLRLNFENTISFYWTNNTTGISRSLYQRFNRAGGQAVARGRFPFFDNVAGITQN